MNYTYDNCAQPTTLGFDVVRTNPDGTTHRLGTYSSPKVAKYTAESYDNTYVVSRLA